MSTPTESRQGERERDNLDGYIYVSVLCSTEYKSLCVCVCVCDPRLHINEFNAVAYLSYTFSHFITFSLQHFSHSFLSLFILLSNSL